MKYMACISMHKIVILLRYVVTVFSVYILLRLCTINVTSWSSIFSIFLHILIVSFNTNINITINFIDSIISSVIFNCVYYIFVKTFTIPFNIFFFLFFYYYYYLWYKLVWSCYRNPVLGDHSSCIKWNRLVKNVYVFFSSYWPILDLRLLGDVDTFRTVIPSSFFYFLHCIPFLFISLSLSRSL